MHLRNKKGYGWAARQIPSLPFSCQHSKIQIYSGNLSGFRKSCKVVRYYMDIQQITQNKERFMELLLLGDEQESMVQKYLTHSSLYVLMEPGIAYGICAVTDAGSQIAEIKNLAILPAFQRLGYGTILVQYVLTQLRRQGFTYVQLGTGETPGTLAFYQKLGFQPCGRIPDFFTLHYDHPIIEEGVQLKDMIYLGQPL